MAAALAGLLAGCAGAAPAVGGALAADAPARYFDLAHWRLRLPDGTSVPAEFLRAGFRNDAFFADPASQALVMRCAGMIPADAGDTDPNPAGVALRETLDPSAASPDADANTWTLAQGTTLSLDLRVDAVATDSASPQAGRVTLAAVAAASGPPWLELRYLKRAADPHGRLFALLRLRRGETPIDLVSADEGGLSLGERVNVQIAWHGTELTFRIGRRRHPAIVIPGPALPGLSSRNLHWVVGVLDISPAPLASDRAQVSYFGLAARHP